MRRETAFIELCSKEIQAHITALVVARMALACAA